MESNYKLGYRIRRLYYAIKKINDIDTTGIIDEVDRNSSTPYHIVWDNGNMGWYSESAIKDIERITASNL